MMFLDKIISEIKIRWIEVISHNIVELLLLLLLLC
jgi:hypothetical protein